MRDAVAKSDDKTQNVYAAVASESVKENKIQILIDMAQGLHKQPQSAKELRNAVSLYYRAYEMSGEDCPLLKARSQVGMASALQAIPDVDSGLLLQAKIAYEEAMPILQQLASPEEIAEAKMNLGLVLQSLVPCHLARITDSIQAYQEALQVFTWEQYPQKYTILHNNIAIAHLSLPMTGEQQYVQQGLAIQTLEAALQHINIIDHPREYGMLQNNLGNAWQYLPATNLGDNLVRAIAAYEQALKVRDPQDTPLEYANTISNKANALFNLPDDLEKPEMGNPQNLKQALTYYQQALTILTTYKQVKQAEIIAQAMQEVEQRIISTL
jgi:tetratricopeptide (TPR) repeat protein